MASARPIILCIDADIEELAACRLSLERERYKVLTAADADHGFDLFLANSVDVVIVFQQNGENDVERIVASMKQAKSHIPIMLLSGYGHLPESTLCYIDASIYHREPPEVFFASLDLLLNVRSTFFSRWIGNWRFSIRSPGARTASEVRRESP